MHWRGLIQQAVRFALGRRRQRERSLFRLGVETLEKRDLLAVSIGIFRSSNRTWLLDANHSQVRDSDDLLSTYGTGGDVPVVGDWDGDGASDIGIFRNGTWYHDNGDRAYQTTDVSFNFGQAGDMPVVGDWNGDGRDQVGVFRDGTWIVDSNSNRQLDGADTTFSFGQAGDVAVTGDWLGIGRCQAGVFRNGTWILDANNDRALNATDLTFTFGQAGDLPVVGDWNDDGKAEVGFYRGRHFYLDRDGDRLLTASDAIFGYGTTGDRPLAGHWLPATHVAFSAAPTTTINVSTAPLTVELRDQFGNAARAGSSGQIVTLHTSSSPAGFRNQADTADLQNVTIARGRSRATFRYRDALPGVATLTASAAGLTGGTVPATVQAPAPPPGALTARSAVGVLHEAGVWLLDANQSGTHDLGDVMADYGAASDVPVAGDWNGDGVSDIGVFRRGTWILDSNGNRSYLTDDGRFSFGLENDLPVAGDWLALGHDQVGVFSAGTWIIDSNDNRQLDAGDFTFAFGQAGDIPVSGDWTGSGHSQVGVFRDGTWILDINNNHALDAGDLVVAFGAAGDQPLVGDWDGDGTANVGVYRAPELYLDRDGDNALTADDGVLSFGAAGDIAVAGHWLPATHWAFATPAPTITINDLSAPIMLQLRDQFGNAARAGSGGLVATLATTSSLGTFRTEADTSSILTVTIARGRSSALVRYRDALPGVATLGASGGLLGSAVQSATIQAPAPPGGAAAAPFAVGVFRAPFPWHLDADQSRSSNDNDIVRSFGTAGDQPVVGDWNGDGVTDVGIFRNGAWYQDSDGDGVTDAHFTFGATGDVAVTGDWAALGRDQIGVFRAGTWYFDSRSMGWPGAGDFQFSFGQAGDVPVTGDWTGSGHSQVGVFRNGTWILDSNDNHALDEGDLTLTFGQSGDLPVVGDWNGDGKTDLGFFRAPYFYLDRDGDGALTGADLVFSYGTSGDIPVAGHWAPATELVFSSPDPAATINTSSAPLTVQLRDRFGNPAPARSGGQVVILSTSSPAGEFRDSADAGAIDSVTIAQGRSSTSFRYRDALPGVPTLTAASTASAGAATFAAGAAAGDPLQSAVQMATIQAPAPPPGLAAAHSAVGLFRTPQQWYFDVNQSAGHDAADVTASFGTSGDVPVVGDWDGDGVSNIGIFRKGTWYHDTNGDRAYQPTDVRFAFGSAGDMPVAGDWRALGHDQVGVFRNGSWVVDSNDNRTLDAADFSFGFGQAGDVPVVGDWTGSGHSQVGVFRNGTWILDTNNNHTLDAGDLTFVFGQAGDLPLVGDWNGDGVTDVGFYRGRNFHLDRDGNHLLTAADIVFGYGTTGDRPLAGRWERATQLVVDGLPQALTAGVPSPLVTVQLLDRFGHLVSAGSAAVELTTTAATGVFRDASDSNSIDAAPSYPGRSGNTFRYVDSGSGPATWTIRLGAFEVQHVVNVFGLANAPINAAPMPTIGVFEGGSWTVDADRDHLAGAGDQTLAFGQAGDLPLVGDWTGSGTKRPGVFRAGTWILDTNGNDQLDAGDLSFVFGQSGDIPVVGHWQHSGRADVGVFRNGSWVLDTNANRQLDAADAHFTFGQAGDKPVVGDFNRDGVLDNIGVFRAGTWYLDVKREHTFDAATAVHVYGQADDVPVVGDWNGDGLDDDLGVYRNLAFILDSNADHVLNDAAFAYGSAGAVPVAGSWGTPAAWAPPPLTPGVFRNSLYLLQPLAASEPAAQVTFGFGQAGDVPLVGDWNGDGTLDTGSFRGSSWYLHTTGTRNTWSNDAAFGFGTDGDVPVVGDWDGDGDDDVGVFRGGMWYLDTGSQAYEPADPTFAFGQAGDVPIAGDWNGDGVTDVGVFRAGTWILDSNGNRQHDAADRTLTFGQAGDTPIAGDWNHDGTTDVGVFRAGTWLIDSNGNGRADVTDYTTVYGQAGDVPVVADWYGSSNSVLRRSAALRQRILREVPNLEALLTTDRMQAALALNDWVANNLVMALSGPDSPMLLDTSFRVGWEAAADIFFNVYQPNLGATWCGGNAYFGWRVFDLFGFESFTVSFGDPVTFVGHVTHVVPVLTDGQWTYFILDPSYNIHFTDSATGDYADYFSMIDHRRSNTLADIADVGLSIAAREYLADREPGVPGVVFQNMVGNYGKYTLPTYSFERYLSDSEQQYIDAGFAPGFRGFVELMESSCFRAGPAGNTAAVDAFLAALDARGIPH